MSLGGSISEALKRFLKTVPVEWVAPVIADYIVGSLKNPESVKKAEPVLVPLRDALMRKYPLSPRD